MLTSSCYVNKVWFVALFLLWGFFLKIDGVLVCARFREVSGGNKIEYSPQPFRKPFHWTTWYDTSEGTKESRALPKGEESVRDFLLLNREEKSNPRNW